MNKVSFVLLALSIIVATNNAKAQKNIIINEIHEHMSHGDQPGFEVAIVDSEPDAVEANWIKLMKKQDAKTSNNKRSIEMFADNAYIPHVSHNTIDVFAVATKASYGTRLTVFVDIDGQFISSREHKKEFREFENFMKHHAHLESIRIVDLELKDQEAIMKDLNKELEILVKNKDSYLLEIEKAKSLIELREKNVEDNINTQNTKRQQLEIQTEIIETIRQKRTVLDGIDPQAN